MTDLAASLLGDVSSDGCQASDKADEDAFQPQQSSAVILICCTLLLQYGQSHHHVFRQIRFAFSSAPPIPHASDDQLEGPSSSRTRPVGIVPVLLSIGLRVGFAIDHFAMGYHPGHRNSHGHAPLPVVTPSIEEQQKELSMEQVRQTERRIGPVLTGLMYELCRVQKLEPEVLALFDEARVDRFFELVELTRDLEDETFNYNLIKLIVSLSDAFPVA